MKSNITNRTTPRIDLTNKRFGKLTVIEQGENYVNPKTGTKTTRWLCKCDCGNEILVRSRNLKTRNTASCGCSRVLNLSGERFGRLTVVERGEDYIIPKTGVKNARWLCKCDCGKETLVLSNSLKQGHTTSCGCLRSPDITGQRFGKLTVISCGEYYIVPKTGKTHASVLCRCDCGKEIIARKSTLLSGVTTTCGCSRTKDLTGTRYGKLTVTGRGEDYIELVSKKHRTRWLCKCDCGNETLILDKSLKQGRTTSCGCLRFPNLSGERFGKLTVIEKGESYVNPKTGVKNARWLCKCDCGKETLVQSRRLKQGCTTSCGCLRAPNLTGERFGKLTVVERGEDYIIPKTGAKAVRWLCKCDCGNETLVRSSSLKQGCTTSCGCNQKKQKTKEKEK